MQEAPSTQLYFIEAKQDDISVILSMMADFYAIDNYPFDQGLTKQNLEKFIADSSLGRLWLIDFEGELAGYLVLAFGFSFEYKGRDAFIDELFLKEPFRNKGIGSQAIQFVIAEAKLLGVMTLHLEAEKHNDRANAIYRKAGFAENNRFLLNKSI